jgi:hypothetical protein
MIASTQSPSRSDAATYSDEVSGHPASDKPLSWRNTLALAVSSILGAVLTVLLSPLLLVAALWLGCSKFTGR